MAVKVRCLNGNATISAQEYMQRHGPFSTEVNAWITQEVQETRCAIASELNVPSETITLTEDVTVGCILPCGVLTGKQAIICCYQTANTQASSQRYRKSGADLV